jgi:hypothetical protein
MKEREANQKKLAILALEKEQPAPGVTCEF